jgi:hypothetical protein
MPRIIETDDIATIKTLIEILNGFIPEANADFIKDEKAYSESLNKKKLNKNSSDNNNSHEDVYDDDIIEKESVEKVSDKGKDKAKIKEKEKTKEKSKSKTKKVESDEDDEIPQSSKKSQSKASTKSSKSKHADDPDDPLESEEDKPKKGKSKKLKSKKDDSENEDDSKKSKKTTKKSKKGNKGEDSKGDDSKEDKDVENMEENRGEIKILTADPNQVMITFIRLKAFAFKKFIVHPDKYSVGLNLDELFKYIKNVDKEGTMNIHIDSDDTQHIIFDVKSENETSQESICELRVLNLSSKKDRRIEADVAMAVRINCQAFHKACKDLMQFSQYVEITCDPSQLAITCKGDLSNHKRIFKVDGTQNGINIKLIKREEDDESKPAVIRLVFDLKYINSMYKCSSLCDDMEIYLNTDSVMFLKYSIKIIGEMLVGISPTKKKKEQNGNYDENDEEFYLDDEEIQLK